MSPPDETPAPADEAQQLARIATVTDDLDKTLDKLFAIAAELKTILTGADAPGPPKEAP